MAREGKRFRFRDLLFWAQSGMICIQDERYDAKDPESFEVVMVREMLFRVRAVNADIHRIKYADEREEHHKFVENMIKCCKEAQTQGRPDDPKAVASMLRHRRQTWVMGSGKDGRTQIGSSVVLGSAQAPESALLPPVPNHPELMDTSKISIFGG